MNKLVKYSIIGASALILGIGLFYAIRFYTTVKRDVKPVLSAIPTDSMLLLRVNHTADFLTYLERQHAGITGLFDLDQNGINSASLKALTDFEKIVEIHNLWISAHFRNNQTAYLMLFNVDALKQRIFERYLEEKIDTSQTMVAFHINNQPVFGGFADGVFIASTHVDLLQEALQQLQQTTNLLNDAALEKVLLSAGNQAPANLFIQIPELAKSLENKVKPEYMTMLQSLSIFSKWMEYDLIDRQDQTLLSGYATQPKSQTFFLDLLAYQTPKPSTIVDVLPSTTRFFFNLNIENFPEFHETYQAFLNEHKLLQSRDSALEAHSEGLSTICKEAFVGCISHELSYFKFLDGYGKLRDAVAFQYDDLADAKIGLERLLNYSPPIRAIESIDKIHRLYLPNLLPNSLFGFLPKSTVYYFSMIGHHLFFTTEEETLLHIRMFFDQQKVLSKTIRLHNFSAQMQDEANLNIYIQDLRTMFKKAPNAACGLQFSGNGGTMYAHAYLQSNAGREREYDQLEIAPKKATPADKIKKAFKGNVVKGPFTVNNHRAKGQPFYLLQDDKFGLYYLDQSGKILWKRTLDGLMKTSITEVDYLKNNKIQYQFQTDKQTYILDIFGRNVGNYPRKH
ncbi:MAG: hypothetical protein LBU91_09440 [Bacteroidales bacterium]|jgi:hypothetical protein|nr:hypothetical protein [Bacteroidales bacterium]